MGLKADQLKIIHTADWHFGHNRTESLDTAKAIRKYVFPEIHKADMFALVGDITDNVISLSSESAKILSALFIDLFFLLYENNVTIRIVRGTILHDRDQLSYLLSILKKLPIELDIKLIDQPSVEVIKKFNTSFLYLPDDLPFKSKRDMLDHVDKLLVQTGGSVDYVLCHGMFDFACKGFIIPDALNANDMKFCKKYVLAGHVHRPQIYKNIIYSGSFDRLAHNEDHKKGFYVLNPEPVFIENKEAIIYKTARYRSTLFEELLKEHVSFMDKYFKDQAYGYVQVKINDIQLKQSLRAFHIEEYPAIKISFDSKKSKNELSSKEADVLAEMRLELPTPTNLPKLLYNHLKENNTEMAIARIKEILDGT